MKYIAVNIFFLWTVSCFATGQNAELVIYEGDTLTMLCEPLETYLQKSEPREKLYPFIRNDCSTALWRGYVGLWQIRETRLFLLDVFACGDKTKSIKDKIFKDGTSEIFADWFTGQLYIEKGKMIKYNHSAYDRYYENETVVTIVNGLFVDATEYTNGVKPGDIRFSRDPHDIQAEIYKRINWDDLPKLSKDKKLYVTIRIDGQGQIKESAINGQIESEYKIVIENIINEFPRVQVFYSRGQPINESWIIPIFFSSESKERYAR